MSESDPTRHSLLVRLRDGDDKQAWPDFVAVYAPFVYRVLMRNGLQAADAADVAQDVTRARNRSFENEICYVGWIEERLLQLLLETAQEARAVQIFTDLVASRDERLPAGHPELAYTRMLLAEAMIAAQQDLAQVPSLLDEAKQILEPHPTFTPEHAWQRIDGLRAEAESANEG